MASEIVRRAYVFTFLTFFSKSRKHDFLRFLELLHTFSLTLVAVQLYINVSFNRPPDRTWRRPRGRPRNKWLDQLRNDSTRPIGDLWSRAVDRGHGGATTRRPSPATRRR